MAPKRKTGVQNVDIGGAYKLDRQLETEQKPDQVSLGCFTTHRTARIEHPDSFLSDAVSQEHVVATTDIADLVGEQEDVDAELEALAMECVSCCCSGCQGSFTTKFVCLCCTHAILFKRLSAFDCRMMRVS